MSIIMSGTLRVVTARELVVLSGSFTSQFKSVRRLRQLRGHASHERYTAAVSNVELQEIDLRRPIRGLNPGPPRDRRIRYHLRYCNPRLITFYQICWNSSGGWAYRLQQLLLRSSWKGFHVQCSRCYSYWSWESGWLVLTCISIVFRPQS